MGEGGQHPVLHDVHRRRAHRAVRVVGDEEHEPECFVVLHLGVQLVHEVLCDLVVDREAAARGVASAGDEVLVLDVDAVLRL